MKTLKKIFIILTLALAMLGTIPVQASPRFNKVAVNIKKPKKNKKKTVTIKLTNLTKQQKKKKWKFTSSDKSVVTVKRNGKNNCKVTAKSKDGYAVIRAQQGADVCYALVRVGVGSENYTPATRVWAETAGFTLPGMKTNNTSGKTNTTTTTTITSKPTRTPIGYTSDGTPYYMDKVVGAIDTGKKDLDGKTIYKFGTQYIIGRTDTGIYVSPRLEKIAFDLEIIPYMDTFYQTFDAGYYKDWVGKNVYMTGQAVLIHIKTTGKIDDSETYFQHGVKETAISKGGDDWYLPNSFEPIKIHPYFGTVVSDGYCIQTSPSKAGTYSYSLTIDGVTKTVSFTVLDRATEFKKWYKTRLENISRQVAIQNAPSGSVFLESLSDDIKEVAGKLQWMNKNYGFIQGGEEGVSWKTKAVTRVIGGVSKSVNLQFVNIYSTSPWWITSKSDPIYRGIESGGCFSGQEYSELGYQVAQEYFKNVQGITWKINVVSGINHTVNRYCLYVDNNLITGIGIRSA